MNKMTILWIEGLIAGTILYRALREAGVHPLLLLGIAIVAYLGAVYWTAKKRRR